MDIKIPATKNIVTGFIVAVLVVLNAWRWWPGSTNGGMSESLQFSRTLAPTDFVLPGVDSDISKPLVRRDLFASASRHAAKSKSHRARRKVSRPKIPASVLRRQQQEADARQAFSAVKLAGVVFRGRTGQAFLTYNGNPVTTEAGEQVFNRFKVVAVNADSIRLKEIKSGMEQTIALSGE